MNPYLLAAGILTLLLGLVHSILGEQLIFSKKRKAGRLIPSKRSADLPGLYVRVIWSTWHIATIFGWCIGFYLIYISLHPLEAGTQLIKTFLQIVSIGMPVSGFMILFASKGKHPGWFILILIGIFVLISMW